MAGGETLQGRVVAITGAASGIGRVTARAFARAGATVVLGDVAVENLEAAVKEAGAEGANARGIRVDVTRAADVAAFVEGARAAHGRLDVLVNNAGVLVSGPFDALTDEETEMHILVNLLGVMHGTRAAARIMRAQPGGGHIVNVASLAGISPVPGAAAYAASKWGVRGYTHSCALELRDTPVRISAVCPDAVETPLLGRRAEGSPIIFSGGAPMDPARVADAILDVVRHPRREVCIPASRGFLARISSLFPGFTERFLPLFERAGEKTLADRRGRTLPP
jgi:3-oxoacyl-[acyl-carrier protein] reductase